jgi:hypothetical protein
LASGTVTVNGQLIIVPTNTVVEMPAAALTWQQVFALAPAPYGIPGNPGVTATVPETGWALSDTNGTPAPLHTYEFTVMGNRVINASGDQWVAALIYISQASLNSGQGFINYIDYPNQELRVGGTIGSSTTGVRVRINDPIITTPGDPHVGRGRYSRGQSPDPRFTCDQGNPTISSQTGYPMGLPSVIADPSVAGNSDDPLCPNVNRPLDGVGNPQVNFTMPAVVAAPAPGVPVVSPTPWLEAPFKVGDYITFAGTLVQDAIPYGTPIPAGMPYAGLIAGPTTAPMPVSGVAGTYISAHTINNNVAIYTAPGTTPAYVIINVTILGTGGAQAAGALEATARTRFEGFTSDVLAVRNVGIVDPSTTQGGGTVGTTTGHDNIHLFGVDIDPLTGITGDRDWGSIEVDQGLPFGAAKGRWRFRPPTTVLTHPVAGAFDPPTRSVRAALSYGEIREGTTPQPQPLVTPLPWVTTANGLVSGQYNAPIFEYLFPEQVPGGVIPPINPEVMQFLAEGIGPLDGPGSVVSASNPVIGQLGPWPGAVAPPTAAVPTAIVAIPIQTVSSGQIVVLDATPSTGTAPMAFSWTQTGPGSPPSPALVLSDANTALAGFTAPVVAAPTTFTFSVTVTNSFGTSTAAASVTVNPSTGVLAVATATPSPVIETAIAPAPVVALDGTTSVGAGLTYSWTQTGPLVNGVLNPAVVINNANSSVANFTSPALGLGAPPVTLSFQLTVSDGVNSSTATVSDIINAPSDAVTIATVVYRSSQQRLTVTATSSAGAAATLTLKSFTVNGVTFPDVPMTLVLGIPTADIRGVPTPTPTQLFNVTSSQGGSASSPVTRFR